MVQHILIDILQVLALDASLFSFYHPGNSHV